MGRPLRKIEPGALYEVTCRCLHGRFLLRPSSMLNRLLIGVIGRALSLFDVQLCFVVFLSNHVHLLLAPRDGNKMQGFLQHVFSNVAREAGRLHRWREKFWGRRARVIWTSTEPEAQIARLVYLLEQGVKEGLVWSPYDWPGVHSAWALANGQPLKGVWIDRTTLYRANKRGKRLEKKDYETEYEVPIAPLPCWAHLDPKEVRQRVRDLVSTIEAAARERHRERGSNPMGVKKIARQDPHDHPAQPKRSKAPLCHTATVEEWVCYKVAYREFVQAFRLAAERLRQGLDARFPAGSFPPRLPHVPHPAVSG